MYDILYVSQRTVDQNNWKFFKNKFPRAQLVENVKTFSDLRNKAFTKLFWAVWDDCLLEKDFHLDYIVPKWDEDYVHVFKNGDHFDGVNIFNKNHNISEKEFSHRFFTNKKEVDIIASRPRPYEQFVIDTYDDYLAAREKCHSELFYFIPKEVEIHPTFQFNHYFPQHNVVDRKSNHVFKHIFRGEEVYTGISLIPKNTLLSQKEIDHRFLVDKKLYKQVASMVQPYDIVFISYNEPNADENYKSLKKRFPRAKRIHGVKGIHQAHIEAAKIVDTIMFWVVDGDAEIAKDFYFDHQVSSYERDIVHVWRSMNPVNDLIYGYGGVKLLPTKLTMNMDLSKPDMTTSISSKFKAVHVLSNITTFNTDKFNTWKSAFRECCKLSSKVIDRQKSDETNHRLDIWCTKGSDRPYGQYAIDGAISGRSYGEINQNDLDALKKINDFEWLKTVFDQTYE